jgi:hypothetical protein
MADPIVDSLEEKLLATVRSGSTSEIEQSVSAWKLATEARQTQRDAAAQARSLFYEQLKSWATIIVPLLTLLTLAVTIWMQSAQLTATREANEDLQWREAIKSLSSSQSGISGVAAVAMLKPFLIQSGRYQQHARDLGLTILPQIVEPGGFRDLLDTIVDHLTWNDIGTLTKINRSLVQHFKQLDDSLEQFKKQGPPTLPRISSTGQLMPSAREVVAVERDGTLDEIQYVSRRMAELLKIRPSNTPLDLNATMLIDCDLADANLEDALLDGTTIQATSLARANLKGIKHFDDLNMATTPWWNAKEIGPTFLKHLIDSSYPYVNPHSVYNPAPRQGEYVERIIALCGIANIECPKESISFGVPDTGEGGESAGK